MQFTFKDYRVSVTEAGVATIRDRSGRAAYTSHPVGGKRTASQARDAARRWINSEIERKRRFTPSELREIKEMRVRAQKRTRSRLGKFG